jgi:hypothetical protein
MENRRNPPQSGDPTEREQATFGKMDALPAFPPPADEEWHVMARNLRVALQIFREGSCDPGLTDQQTLILLYATTLSRFLYQIPEANSEGLHQPLVLLVDAFHDLAHGTVPDLFRPVRKPMNRPKDQRIDDRIKGIAARALNYLIVAGRDRMNAARFVVKALRDFRVRGSANLRPETIINWRARCSEGHGSMSAVALQHYSQPLPQHAGLSPAELEGSLVSELRQALIIREPHSQ